MALRVCLKDFFLTFERLKDLQVTDPDVSSAFVVVMKFNHMLILEESGYRTKNISCKASAIGRQLERRSGAGECVISLYCRFT